MRGVMAGVGVAGDTVPVMASSDTSTISSGRPLTNDEIEEFTDAFKYFDTNDDGCMSTQALSTCVSQTSA